MGNHVSQLHLLAKLYGVQTSYYDVNQHRQVATPKSLIEILKAIGAPLKDFSDVQSALRYRLNEQSMRLIEPVIIAWNGKPDRMELQFPADISEGLMSCKLALEEGAVKTWTVKLSDLPFVQSVNADSTNYASKRYILPIEEIPFGYHKLVLDVRGIIGDATVISAPMKAYKPKEDVRWGVFIPLYTLHSVKSWGAGDFTALEELMAWISSLGGGVVATLPLLPSFLDEPFEPSPYSPVSRLLWNELYIDVTRSAEMNKCPDAQRIISNPEMIKEINRLKVARLVDYKKLMRLKRRVLDKLAECYFSKKLRPDEFEKFCKSKPEVYEYAQFRAEHEQTRNFQRAQDVIDKSSDVPLRRNYDKIVNYYLYSQWIAHKQFLELAKKAQKLNTYLYLDFPLGVHPNGFDAYKWPDLFVESVSAGAPPDAFFVKGQNWYFNPLHPERLRRQRYRYFIECLRHHMRYAKILRIDHVMSLHRLFWIPKGFAPANGVYVRYKPDEFYAILSLESHRHKCIVVGENLGTVPRYVDRSMIKHGIFRMYVLQYDISPSNRSPLSNIPFESVASLNTHDMPTFAAFLRGLDITDRVNVRLIERSLIRKMKQQRTSIRKSLLRFLKRKGRLKFRKTLYDILGACIEHLASSNAWTVLVNLEDLWLELQPQNFPGTGLKRPNFRRKARFRFEHFTKDKKVFFLLEKINRFRQIRNRKSSIV